MEYDDFSDFVDILMMKNGIAFDYFLLYFDGITIVCLFIGVFSTVYVLVVFCIKCI